MSDREPKSDPPPPDTPADTPAAKRASAPADPRAGFVTMPNDLRVFTQQHPHAVKLAELPGAIDAAAKLREAGRGPDVLYEDLRAEPPRDPAAAADENRSEHLIVEMPAGVSPWGKDAAAAKEAAAVTIDKAALPSASAPPSTRTTPGKPPRKGAPGSKATSERRDRRWFFVIGLAVTAVLVAIALRPRDEPGSRDDPTSGVATAVQATGMTAATTAATIEPMTTGTSPATSAAPTTTGALPTSTQVPTASVASATKLSPKLSGDPYADAGALPRPPASADPSVAPAVTTAPSARPSATSTSPWDVVFEKKKDSGNQ
jgi:hypothetical protein